jgi:putative spermidine/putrescine transport system ATP-binding protein
LLRIVAGFIRQTQGQVLLNGKTVDHLPANRRGVGIVFQNYALFPHLSVREMSTGLYMRVIGQPACIGGLEKFLDYIQGKPDVWITRRVDIARHWRAVHPYRG